MGVSLKVQCRCSAIELPSHQRMSFCEELISLALAGVCFEGEAGDIFCGIH